MDATKCGNLARFINHSFDVSKFDKIWPKNSKISRNFFSFFSLIVMLKSLPLTARRRLSFTPNNPLPTEKKSLMTTNSRLKTKKFCACAQRKIAENISIRRKRKKFGPKFGHFKIMLVFLQYHHCCILIFESVERKWILVTLCHRLHEFYFALKMLRQVEYSKGEKKLWYKHFQNGSNGNFSKSFF